MAASAWTPYGTPALVIGFALTGICIAYGLDERPKAGLLMALNVWLAWVVMATFFVLAITPFVNGRRFGHVRRWVRWAVQVSTCLMVFGVWAFSLTPKAIGPYEGMCIDPPMFGLTNHHYDDAPRCVQANQISIAIALVIAVGIVILAMLTLDALNRRATIGRWR